MLQPKKPNPAQKNKRKVAPGQYTSDIDWDQVRKVNDNVAVQAAKMFDPTGISSYPDVYYAAKDLSEGKGSWGELGLNILGALPMVGKAKTIFRLGKYANASKAIKNTVKVAEAVEKVAVKANKLTNLVPLANSTNKVLKTIGKGAEKAERVAKIMSSPVAPKSVTIASSILSKADIKNLAVDVVDLANVGADAISVVKAGVKATEEPSVINKDKIAKTIQYYNQDPRRGEVETPGKLASVDYKPINNSAELKVWEQQKLAFGTNQDGIMKKSMNPRKKYLNGSNSGGVTPNGIPSPASTLNDYQIMMAQAEYEAANNEWLPVVAAVGGIAQSAISMGGAGGFKKGAFGGGKTPDIQATGAEGVVAANGNNSVNSDVEVEGGERYETPQGDTGEFKGPSHEEGGIPMEVNQDIPEGTKVYSDRLKVGDKTLADRKAARDRQTANLEKIATQPLVDSAIKNATKRKMGAIQKEEEADLLYQEQVNNMQQMADAVVKAFGTSAVGVQKNPVGESMRYANGTSADGVTEYGWGSTEDGIIPGFIEGFGINAQTDEQGLEENPLYNDNNPFSKSTSNSNIDYGKLLSFSTEGINDNASLSYGDPYAEDGVTYKKPTETIMTPADQYGKGVKTTKTPGVNLPGTMLSRGVEKGIGAMGKAGIPSIGDMTSLFGDYLGATSGLKNAAEQRGSDVTHQNVYANVGKEAQTYLDKAMGNVDAMKDQAIMKATSATRGSKISANNSSRGVNQKKATNWLYDQGLADNIASISGNAANQVADIYKTKSSTSFNADQLKGKGEFDAANANEAAKDAYYTAKGLALSDQANAVKQGGKDLNGMKQNKLIEKLMASGYGKWTGLDSEMNATNKNAKTTTSKTTKGMVEMPDGKGGKISITDAEFQKLMNQVTKTK